MLGSPAVLNVWATWCAGCRQEHPFLMQLARSGEVPLYGMNYRDERPKALDWLRRLGDPYVKVGYDPEGMGSLDWGVYGSPETFLIDPRGHGRLQASRAAGPDGLGDGVPAADRRHAGWRAVSAR
jgi:cytochrome c biogenesis protein CcmG, thiol:disulfide interchange protein DsbE